MTVILAGIVFFIPGVLVYVTDRAPETVYFLSGNISFLSLYHKGYKLFGSSGNYIPDFIHVFSFSMITSGWLGVSKVKTYIPCVFWFTVNALFEAGQAYPDLATALIPEWFENVPFLENACSFFRNGTFDMCDMVSFAAGASAAWLVLEFLRKRMMDNDLALQKNNAKLM